MPCSLPWLLTVVLRKGRDIPIAHAWFHSRKRRAHGAVLHQRGAANEFLLLGALDHLDAVDEIGSVDELGVGKAPLLHVIDHRKRHLIGADQSDGAASVRRQRLGGEFGIVGRGVIAGRITRRRVPGLHAAAHPVTLAGEFVDAGERALIHQRHQIVARKDDSKRVAVGRRQIGEVFHVAAHLVAIVLHQERVDFFVLHGGAHGLPAALQLGRRDRRLQAFGQLHFHSPCRGLRPRSET